MANDRDLILAFKKAAEALLGRSITDEESSRLIKLFNETKGTHQQRALAALSQFADVSESLLLEKTAASDNTDRVISDLKNTLDNWKPGS